MSKQVKQPDLPGCEHRPLRFKDVECTNEAGSGLSLCNECGGSGKMCSGVRKTYHKMTGEPQEETATFNGAQEKKYTARGGWTVTSTPCVDCNGAGLKLAEGVKQ